MAAESGESIFMNQDRILNSLNSENKMIRKETLTKILKEVRKLETFSMEESSLSNLSRMSLGSEGDVANISSKKSVDKEDSSHYLTTDRSSPLVPFIEPIVMCLYDPMEKCRELAVETLLIVWNLFEPVKLATFLPTVVNTLCEQLGQRDVNEPSEEVRLLEMNFLSRVVQKMFIATAGLDQKSLAPFVEDIVCILEETIVDPFPLVRIVSCDVTSVVAVGVPQVFFMISHKLIRPLCSAVTHQQFRVRTAAVKTIGDVIMLGNHKCIDDVLPSVTQRLFDSSPIVRKAVIEVVASWMTSFIDRYSHFHKLLPLILTGLCDESPDVTSTTEELWSQVGERYLEENAQEYKDQVDFPADPPKHYPNPAKRPNLGCRILTWQNVCKILPGAINDLKDWTDPNRQKAAQLIYNLCLISEVKMTMHTEPLLQGLFRACLDEDPIVRDYILKTARLIGAFIPFASTGPILIYAVQTVQNEGPLAILANVLSGCYLESMKPLADDVSDLLSSKDVCQTLKAKRQTWLVRSCIAYMDVLGEEIQEKNAFNMFKTLLTVMAMGREDSIQENAIVGIKHVRDVSGFKSLDDMLRKFSTPILNDIKVTSSEWTPLTPDKLIFAAILSQGVAPIEENMDVILEILIVNLQPSKDPEVRLKFFSLLSEVLSSNFPINTTHAEKFHEFVCHIIRDILEPNLVWRAGKTAGALRTASASCLLSILQSRILTRTMMLDLTPKLTKAFLALLDDSEMLNRLISTKCLGHLAVICAPGLSPEVVHQIYPEMLKRMDDDNDEIRISACATISSVFKAVPSDYDVEFLKIHLQNAYSTLLIHLDDQDECIQEAVYDALRQIGPLRPDIMIQECEKVKGKHRSPANCSKLIAHFAPTVKDK